MPFALLIPASNAAAPPVDVTNNTVTCNTINKGVLKLKPPLVNGGTTPVVATLQGKLAGCTTDASGVTINDFKSSFKGTFNLPGNDCLGLLTQAGQITGTITIKWNATPKITPSTSTVTVSPGDVIVSTPTEPWGGAYPQIQLGDGGANPLAVSGAFTGGDGGANSIITALLQEDLAVFVAACGGNGVKAGNVGLGQFQLS